MVYIPLNKRLKLVSLKNTSQELNSEIFPSSKPNSGNPDNYLELRVKDKFMSFSRVDSLKWNANSPVQDLKSAG